MKKILMIIKTSSVDYDERLKKEIDSILNIGESKISIFAVEDYLSNYSKESVVVSNPKFVFRNKKGISKVLTLIELIVRLKKTDDNPKFFDKVWIHDPIMMLILPFLKLKKNASLIWDLHELPRKFIVNYRLFRWIFRKIASRCNTIIVANKERGEYMVKKGLIKSYEVLYNYPILEEKNDNKYIDIEFENWIGKKEFAYSQSATHPTRNFTPLAKACVNKKQYLLVVGERNEAYHYAKDTIPGFDDYILVLGRKPSDKLYYYISRAKYSFVFYSNKSMNNYLCAPNRMYHSLKFGLPVVVGANPTMANIVESYKCGVRLKGFGESHIEIEDAIKDIVSNYEFYKSNTKKVSKQFNWHDQEVIIKKILNK